MNYRPFFFIPLLLIFFSCQKKNVQTYLNLSDLDWTLSSSDTSITVRNIDPSDIHIALFNAGVIPDPFFSDNEKELQWVGQQTWKLETSFDLDQAILSYKNIEMVFNGLDTYADVTLNDSLILSANNMFRTWRVNLTDLLKVEENNLCILFHPPEEKNEKAQAEMDYPLPDNRSYTRKAAYQLGWDWGPIFVTSGIWKPAYLKAWNGAVIRDVYTRLSEIRNDTAHVSFEVELESSLEKEYKTQIFVNNKLYSEIRTQLTNGINKQKVNVQIPNPKLWWPVGYGEQNLYQIQVNLLVNNQITDSHSLRTGLKVIELVQEPDSVGSNFYFKVNSLPVFVKGANYIPQDNFLPRLKKEDYIELLQDAKKSNMNMLRVWGGGIYEKDIFFELCDEQGIMVWQDFLFACNLYPGDSLFNQNVKLEAIDNIKRIRNHPSLVIWCGNNEVNEAWYNWGWQKQFGYNTEDSLEIWNNYIDLFEKILPELVLEYNPDIPYWPSSPSNGWGHDKAYKEGDVHYWGVWWGKEPFEMYKEKVGRFMSEYGFQGMPDLKTIHEFTSPEDRNLSSEVMNVHQKHPFGWEAIHEYMLRDFKVPQLFDDYVYVSQLLQARGIRTAIEAHRRAKPYCMGTLYWQFNDCWPVTSWSGIDYYGRWKAMQYHVKKAYKTYLVSFNEERDSIAIYVVSDSIHSVDASLVWKIIDFDGNILRKGQEEIILVKNSSTIFKKIGYNELKGSKSNILLSAELVREKRSLASAYHYFEKPRNLELSPVKIQMNIEEDNNRYVISLASETLVKSVQINTGIDGFLSDNYFDLLPLETKKIYFLPEHPSGQIPKFQIKCLNNIN